MGKYNIHSMKLQFDTNGNEKQKEACRYWTDKETFEIIYGGSKGSGKSYLGCQLIFADALMYPETHYFIARKALNDIRKFTIPSIHEVFTSWGLGSEYYKFNGQDNLYTLYNGSKVFLLEAKYQPSDPLYYRFGSMQMTRGWIEEAGQFDEEAKNNLAASIGRWKNEKHNLPGKLLETCNPSKNYLYKDYKAFKSGKLPDRKKFIQALPTDNKRLDSGYLDNLNQTLSKNEKERLLYGNWEYDDDPAALCIYDKILDMFTNDFKELSGEKFITADIARFGSDTIKIGLWEGWRVKCFSYSKQSITTTAEIIDKLRKENNIPLSNVLADEDGVGGGVVDILRCKGFINNSRPLPNPTETDPKKKNLPENYENLQAQCAFKFAERLNRNGVFFDCPSLKAQEDTVEELEQLKQKNADKDGKKGIVPKEKVKELIGRSPDYRDMLIMREWFEFPGNRRSGKFDYGFGTV